MSNGMRFEPGPGIPMASVGPRSCGLPLEELYPPGHLLWIVLPRVSANPSARISVRRFAWVCWVTGRDITKLTAADISEWAAMSNGNSRRAVLHFYREAMDLGLLDHNPAAHIPFGRRWIFSRRRITEEQARSIVEVLRAKASGSGAPSLAAARNLVIIAFGSWLGCDAQQLRQLIWADLRFRHGRDYVRLPWEPDVWRELPLCVARVISEWRTKLESFGVGVVPEDALLPGMHPAVVGAWLAGDRSLLAPLRDSGMGKGVNDSYRAGGVTPRRTGPRSKGRRVLGELVWLEWIQRSTLVELERVLAPAISTRIAMKRVV
jgi:integrase